MKKAELVKILEAAQENQEYGMHLFKQCQEAEENHDSEMENIYWAASNKATGVARGLLKAYEIMTSKEVYEWQIKDELKALA